MIKIIFWIYHSIFVGVKCTRTYEHINDTINEIHKLARRRGEYLSDKAQAQIHIRTVYCSTPPIKDVGKE